tara:strand:- start:1088 stop:1495 length:408 start_codon:yes stop_codon:yes gene_type:complete
MDTNKFKKIKFTKKEVSYIKEAIEMLDLYSDTLSYHNLYMDSTVNKILDTLYKNSNTEDTLEITEPGLVCFLTYVDQLNCFLIEYKTEMFTSADLNFFKLSDKFFNKHNKYSDLRLKWSNYKKYIYNQPVYVKQK